MERKDYMLEGLPNSLKQAFGEIWRTVIRASCDAKERHMNKELSVLPSSININSRLEKVCVKMLFAHFSIDKPALYTGTITEIKGFIKIIV